jgi:hypothetical protein
MVGVLSFADANRVLVGKPESKKQGGVDWIHLVQALVKAALNLQVP